ncbi:MAG: hypothetical protein HUK15_10175, partial [Bacteroidales bacterium]|nr:hypothetical protein [Bacteroidales bacterium]
MEDYIPRNPYPSSKAESRSSSAFSIAKIFGIMGAGLLITALVAFGLGFAIYYLLVQGADSETLLTTYA